ncbi:MAG TPA: FAD-dependent oxidoreductase [Gaiellaceae bacterium]
MSVNRDWPGLVLRLAQARGGDGQLCPQTFVLGGSHETRVTVVAQQARAINLAWALHRTGRLVGRDGKPSSVGVVGAGAAGATFAAAAGLLGANVTLVDEHEEPITTQRWSFDRYLHPNLFDWPVEGWNQERAGLPLMDWAAGPSARVRLELLAGFALAAARGGVTWCSQHSVSEVDSADGKVKLTVCDLRSTAEPDAAGSVRVAEESYDLVVVATGFLPEPRVGDRTTMSGSYWKDNDLAQVLDDSEQRHHTIVGDGDGALTELLRLSLIGREAKREFNQSMLTTLATQLLDADRLREDVLSVEAGISGTRGKGTLHAYASGSFDGADDSLRDWLRPSAGGVEVRAGRVTSLRNAFALNRFLAARLTAGSSVRFLRGAPFLEADVPALAPSRVVWRTGPRPRVRTLLVRPALAVKDAGDALAGDPSRQDVLGTVDDLMDASREPRWDARARELLAVPAEESALKAAVDLERGGLAVSRGFGWKPAGWPASVDAPPLPELPDMILDLARMALSIGNGPPPEVWSNFLVNHDSVAVSLDLVAVAADRTPTEIIDQLRRTDAPGIRLVLIHVPRGPSDLERVWIRVDPAQAAAHLSKPGWTAVSLLLAPGFAAGDSFDDGETRRFESHAAPRTEDSALDVLAERLLNERAIASTQWVTADRITAAVAERSSEQTLLQAAREGDARLERALVTVLHRRLGDGDPYEFRSALLGLAALVGTDDDRPGSVTDVYLATVLALPAGDRAGALVRAALGPLVRLDPATGELVPLSRYDDRLRSESPEVLAAHDGPPHDGAPHGRGVPDFSDFAVRVSSTDTERAEDA